MAVDSDSEYQILCNVTGGETRIAWLRNQRVQAIEIERSSNLCIVDNIYLAKVSRVVPGMQAAFLDIGRAKQGFLHVRDIVDSDTTQQTLSVAIERRLHAGQKILVQAVQGERDDKGARLSTDISLAGETLVLRPFGQDVAVSRRLKNSSQVNELQSALIRSAQLLDYKGGIILRTQAARASVATVLQELQHLLEQWQAIVQAQQSKAPDNPLWCQPLLLQRMLRNLRELPTTVIFDDQAALDVAQNWLRSGEKRIPIELQFYTRPEPMFAQLQVDSEIEGALRRRVDLTNGAQLLIDELETMTVIDVNTAANLGGSSAAETILQTNIAAALEIAKQLSLRNIGGIVIVDFINMASLLDRSLLQKKLSEVFSGDPRVSEISEISELGLVQFVRSRNGNSLQQTLCQSCSKCQGGARELSATTHCFTLLRKVAYELAKRPRSACTLCAAPAMIKFLQTQEAASLAWVQDRLSCRIDLQDDEQLPLDDYRLIPK